MTFCRSIYVKKVMRLLAFIFEQSSYGEIQKQTNWNSGRALNAKIKVRKTATIQSSTTPDPRNHKGKKQKYNKHNQQEPRGQPFPSRWLQGSNEQTRKHEKHKTQKTQMIHKRSTALERSIKYYNGGLKPVSRRQPRS